MFQDILVLIAAFITCCYTLQKTIYVSKKKQLFDIPSESRKIHIHKTPNLGGVAVYSSFVLVFALFSSFYGSIPHVEFLIAATLILFFTGVTDDLAGMNPYKKLVAQILCALLVAIFTEYRITNLYGLFSVAEIPVLPGIILTTIFITFLTNAYNLIDGINWLAGTLGIISFGVFAILFSLHHDTGFLLLCLALCGCLSAFLLFNKTPARIFLGDSGSLMIGFLTAIFSLRYLALASNNPNTSAWISNTSAPAIVMAIVIIPLIDTTRVFVLRLLKKRSPFTADRNHLHHLLLDRGFSHLQSTAILILCNSPVLLLAFTMEWKIYNFIPIGITSVATPLIVFYLADIKSQQFSAPLPKETARLISLDFRMPIDNGATKAGKGNIGRQKITADNLHEKEISIS